MLPLYFFKALKRLFSRIGSLAFEPVGKLKHRPRAGDHRSFYDVFQFPHITGPVVLLETLASCSSEWS